MVEITDEGSARAWLETQPKQVCVAMAARSALRGVAGLRSAKPTDLSGLALPVMRAILTAGAVSTCPANAVSDLERAAISAESAARSAISAAAAAFSASSAANSAAFSAAAANSANSAVRLAAFSANSAAESVAGSAANPVFFASYSAAFAAYNQDANSVIAGESLELLFHRRVWQLVDEPEGLAEARAALLRFLGADPAKWDFWARWYRGMFDGQPMDWALQRGVALIPDKVWHAGPEAVAKRIAAIERDFKGEPLDQDALEAHVRGIAKASDFHADAAESVATTLDTAIRAYCQLAEANELPEGFAQFTRLESGFRAISVTLRQPLPAEDKTAELQAQINELHGIVGTLQRELSEARAQLVDARLNVLEAERQRRWGTALRSTLADVSTIGAFGLGALAFFGVKAEDFGYDAVRRDAIALAEEYAAPDRSPRPVPRPTAAPDKSPRPEPRQTD